MAVETLRVLLPALLLQMCSLVACRKMSVSAIAVGLLLAPLPAGFAHERLDLAGHAAVSAMEASEHGHSHDDEETGDTSAGHSHSGHDPADHSHQPAFLAASVSHWVLPLPQRWPTLWNSTSDQAAGTGIERPPKRMMSA
jgi:hypothetical protein